VRVVVALGVVMAVGTEVVQGMLPWPRAMDPLDMLADVVGVAAGLWVARRLRARARTG
jgi:VanZ family protein